MASEYKLNKHRKMRAKARKRAYLKDLAYRQAVKACWLGDWLELDNDKADKFESHGHYPTGKFFVKDSPGTPCITIP
jgi:hypothetical protein